MVLSWFEGIYCMTVSQDQKVDKRIGPIITQFRALSIELRGKIICNFLSSELAAQAFLDQQNTGFRFVPEWLESLKGP